MKKLILFLLVLTLFSCGKKENYLENLNENITACIQALDNNNYIVACDDTIKISKNYLNSEEEIDLNIYEDFLNNLQLTIDLSDNKDFNVKVDKLMNKLAIQLSEDQFNSLNLYNKIENKDNFKLLAKKIDSDLEYIDTIKKSVSKNLDNFIYITTFKNKDNVYIQFQANDDTSFEQLTIFNSDANLTIYLHYIKTYSKQILLTYYNSNEYNANFDSHLIENKIQFDNQETFKNKHLNIEINDNIVVFKN